MSDSVTSKMWLDLVRTEFERLHENISELRREVREDLKTHQQITKDQFGDLEKKYAKVLTTLQEMEQRVNRAINTVETRQIEVDTRLKILWALLSISAGASLTVLITALFKVLPLS